MRTAPALALMFNADAQKSATIAAMIHSLSTRSREAAISRTAAATPSANGAQLRRLMDTRARGANVRQSATGKRMGSDAANGNEPRSEPSPTVLMRLIRQTGHLGSVANPHETSVETGSHDPRSASFITAPAEGRNPTSRGL